MNVLTPASMPPALNLAHLQVEYPFKPRYGNFINGEFVDPKSGAYFENVTPITGDILCEVARSDAQDVELALDAAHAAKDSWGKTPPAERALILNKIADVIEANTMTLAVAETLDNGKPIRETVMADIPACAEHFRYFAGCIRADEGSLSEVNENTIAYHYHDPVGVVALIVPWNFPLLLSIWKIAPALAAGNTVILKPAEQTPASILVLMEQIAELLPPGVLNVVNGFGLEAGKPLASSPRVNKISFTGETSTGRLIMQYASQNIIPVTLELGGKSPNVFFENIMDQEDELLDKALEGISLFAFNQGEVCTCPSRAIIQESIYDEFMEKAIARIQNIKTGNPLHFETMIGAQASAEQKEKILSYIALGQEEGATLLTGGEAADMPPELANGYYLEPTVFEGHNAMKIFQEEIFGPVLSVTVFKDEADALKIANDTLYGLAAGVWTRDGSQAYRMGRGIQAGRVWTNCYHEYPAHAAFGGYKQSGFGRENHKMMLDHYRQTKNVLVSHNPNALGFF